MAVLSASPVSNTVDTDASAFAIRLFGPMQVLLHNKPLPRMRSRKAFWLLALLTLRHGRPVEREWLGDRLWPYATGKGALTSLRAVLSELRSTLGSQAVRLQSPSRHTLSIDLSDAQVDLLEFDAAIARGELSGLDRALALYRGPLLEGCLEEWAVQDRVAREQDCLQALCRLGDAALSAGDPTKATAYWRRAVSLDPFWEVARRGVMEGLAQGGDNNAALQSYREFVNLLHKGDPKAMPDEETTALYNRLRNDARSRAVITTAAPASVVSGPEPPVTGYLPHHLTELVGRVDECGEVIDRLYHSRLVTLTGPGGIGKTRLATAVAEEMRHEYPDGVWMVALESVFDPSLVPCMVARVLGTKEETHRPLIQTLAEYLRDKKLLLVLDNCEHLLEASAQLTGHLLRECAGLKVLTTSREPLGITGELAWSVPPLAVLDPDHLPEGQSTRVRVLAGYEGVQLFVERAQAVQKSFSLTGENASSVARVCSRLEGLPLALELAAAMMRVMTVSQMTDRLSDHLGLLTAGNRAALPRQQTMRATLDWSYTLLSVPEQLLLTRLSVFAGGWTLEAAEIVCAGEGIAASQVLELLRSLVGKSLVAFSAQDGSSGLESGGRYRLLEAVRQYAAERLTNAATLRARHRDWCLALAEQAEPYLRGTAQAVWLNRMATEQDNLRAALDWRGTDEEGGKDAETNLRLAGALSMFWFVYAHFSEGCKYLEQALSYNEALSEGKLPAARIKALIGLGRLAYCRGNYAEAQALFDEGLTLGRQQGDQRAIATALQHLGDVAEIWCDFPQAHALYEESLSLFREIEDQHGIAKAICGIGQVYESQGDPAAEPLYQEGLQIFEELGDTRQIAWVLTGLGSLARRRGDYGRAWELFERGLGLYQELGDRQGATILLGNLGNIAYDEGDYDTAQMRYEEVNRFCRNLGNQKLFAWSVARLGKTAHARGDYDQAQAFYTESLEIQRQMGTRGDMALTLHLLGDVAQSQKDFAKALSLYRESIRLCREMEDKEGIAENLSRLPAVLMALGEPLKAVHLLGAANALRSAIGFVPPPRDQKIYDQHTEELRAALGADTFSTAWEKGNSLTWDQAMAYALEEDSPEA